MYPHGLSYARPPCLISCYSNSPTVVLPFLAVSVIVPIVPVVPMGMSNKDSGDIAYQVSADGEMDGLANGGVENKLV